MRVAIISLHTCPLSQPGEKDAGGMNIYVQRMAEALGSLGCAADVYTRSHPGEHPIIVDVGARARVVHIPCGPLMATKEALLEHVPAFTQGVLRFAQNEHLSYDIIHSHYWLSGRAGLELRRAWNTPLVATFHTLAEIKRQSRAGQEEPESRVQWERHVSAEADALLVSTIHEQQALQHLFGVSSAKVAVIAPGVDLDLFRPMGAAFAQQTLGISGKRVLLFVGRLDPLKGLDLALQAVALLEDQEDLELMVVGGEQNGEAETLRLRALAERLGLQRRVRFTGPIPHNELPYYYSAAEALVMPSYYESFGLAALEAMACGTPVVASRVGGLPWVVRDGETGYLVPWLCPEPFSRRLEVLLAHKDLRDSMGRAARQWALGRDWRAVAQQTLTLYTEVTQSQSHPVHHG